MVQAVRSSIVKDINESDVKWFTLMEDGTRDKNNRENIALAIRYVKDGVVNESLLMVKTTENLDAATFTELTLNTLTENNIDPLVCLANAMMAQNIDENDEPFKSEYFETLDILIAELQRRFSDNDDLINSIASLDELDVDKMVPLKNLGLKIPSREEASVVKAYLSRNEDIMENTLQVLYRQREAFKDTYELLSVATIGCSTAVCESTFSTLTAINRPQRLSMGHERMAATALSDSDIEDEDDIPLIGYQNPIYLLIRKSITEYLAEKLVTNNVDPLTWWKVNKQRYGLLSPIARQCLVTPPTSVPIERMFSGAGIIYTPHRNRLEGEKASKFLFLKYNILY
ncbi:Zinc finger BED domain-containing protein 4 [Eumeta japonica]|uniref:Zinc finger BED domain-containing protein 4 n=1 Tax=Eumeta variegata TaxID=151549 RepID=A0A4C1XP13_EUMVA|nr:Zinc finger BED domain-containing protein 4 [Eumeta japonica]